MVAAVCKLFAARPGAFKTAKDVDLLFDLIEKLFRSPYGACSTIVSRFSSEIGLTLLS